jgi:hypothetical protein
MIRGWLYGSRLGILAENNTFSFAYVCTPFYVNAAY